MKSWNAKRLVTLLLASVLLVACGNGDGDPIAERIPQGTEADQQALEDFLSNPFITEEQAEQSRDMVWRACAHFDEGGEWQEFEDQQVADREDQGAPLTALELGGMRSAAALGVLAYCPAYEASSP